MRLNCVVLCHIEVIAQDCTREMSFFHYTFTCRQQVDLTSFEAQAQGVAAYAKLHKMVSGLREADYSECSLSFLCGFYLILAV